MEFFHLWRKDGRNTFAAMKIIRVNFYSPLLIQKEIEKGLDYLVMIEVWPPLSSEALL